MSASLTCPSCATPVGESDRLCWNCGASTTPAPGDDLGATRRHADLAELIGVETGTASPPQGDELLAVDLEKRPDGALRAGSGDADDSWISGFAEALPPSVVAQPSRAGGFCGSCGSSFADRAEAQFCASCGAARSSAPAAPSLSAKTPPLPVGAVLSNAAVPVAPGRSAPSPTALPGTAGPATQWTPDPQELWGRIGPIDRSLGGRIRRGWQLTKLSLDLMRRQPGLVAVPSIVAGIIGVLFILLALITHGAGGAVEVILWVPGLAVMASVSMIGQAVITRRVAVSVSGATETNSQALTAIRPRLWDVCKWGMLSATVGAVIRSLGRGRGPIGVLMRILSVALAVIWSSMTFFVLPVILFEGLSVGPAITRSKQLVRLCWGEGVVGVGVLSALLNLAGFAGVLLAVLFLAAHVWVLAVLILLATIVGINVVAAVASPVFTLVLYRYATTGQVAFGLSVGDLGAAFRRPKALAR